jgi:uncharacterized protein YjbI with pentapeptide repeats
VTSPLGLGEGVVAFDRATLQDVDFRKVRFEHFSLRSCTFIGCDFRGIRFDRKFQPLFASPRQSVFRECRFEGSDLRAIDPAQSRFERCFFDGALIEKWSAGCAEFIDCRFVGPIIRSRFFGRPWGPEATRLDPPRSANAFRGNDFSRADLVETVFVMGIDVKAQRWPSGDEYVRLDRIHQRLTRARAEILRWKNLDERNAALDLLQRSSLLYVQQNEIITKRLDPRSPTPEELQLRVWDLLASVM